MRILLVAMSLAGAAVAQPALAQAQQSTSAISHEALALEAAKLAQPREMVLESAMAALGKAQENFASSADFRAIEEEFPGFSKAYMAAAMPEIRKILDARIPELWSRLAGIYASELETSELQGLHAFMASPLGVKVIRIGTTAADESAAKDVATSDGAEFTAKDVRSAAMAGGRAVMKALTADELLAFMRVINSPTGKAMMRVGPKVQASIAEWGNEMTPAEQEKMAAIALGVLEDLQAKRTGAGK